MTAQSTAEKEWLDAVVQLGCIACHVSGKPGTPCEVHHMLEGGRRKGHLWAIGLCPLHHRGGRNDAEIVSRHPWHKAFEKRYGTEQELLEKSRRMWEAKKYGRTTRPWWWLRSDHDLNTYGSK